jgi:hypothetical protein
MALKINPTLLHRTYEHIVLGLTASAPINMAIVYIASVTFDHPLVIAVTTTALATVISGIRTYFVLKSQDKRTVTL